MSQFYVIHECYANTYFLYQEVLYNKLLILELLKYTVSSNESDCLTILHYINILSVQA